MRHEKLRSGLLAAALACGLIGFSLGDLLAENPRDKDKKEPPKATQPAPATKATPAPQKGKIDEAAVLEFLKVHEPDVYKWAIVLKEKDGKRFNELIKEFTNEVKKLTDLQQKKPELFELTMQDRRHAFRALQLAKDLRNEALSPEARERASEELQKVVDKQFEVRQKLREMELAEQAQRIEALQKQLNGHRQELANREKHKQQLIAQRVNDLLKKNPKVEW